MERVFSLKNAKTQIRCHWQIYIVWALSVAGLVDALLLLSWYCPNYAFDGIASEVWAAMADDVAQGQLYRPLLSQVGYGGTRYMPVFFTIYGLFVKVFGDHILAGYFLMQITVVFAMYAIFTFAKALRLNTAIALGFCASICANNLYQQYLTDINCEYFSLACSVLGLTCWLKNLDKPCIGDRISAYALFALAFMSKFTALYGPGCIFIFYLVRRRWKESFYFGCTMVTLLGSLILLFDVISEHNMIKVITLLWDGGPRQISSNLFSEFLEELFFYQPFVGILLVATVLMLVQERKALPDFAPVVFFAGLVLGVTLLIYTSPGISGNHLIPVQASCVMLCIAIRSRDAGHLIGITHGILFLVLVLTWIPGVPSVRSTLRKRATPVSELEEICQKELHLTKGLITPNPIVALRCGLRPRIADNFQFELLLRRVPAVRDDFFNRIKSHSFEVIITTNSDPSWLVDWKKHYIQTAKYSHYRIFRPIQSRRNT